MKTNEPLPIPEGEIDVAEIDHLLDSGVDSDALVGKQLRWHDDQLHELVKLKDGSLGMRLVLHCGWCLRNNRKRPRRTTVYTSSGLHSGAWCYAHDRRGKYLANLRDQEYKCPDCCATDSS